jgi:hypothetical protein
LSKREKRKADCKLVRISFQDMLVQTVLLEASPKKCSYYKFSRTLTVEIQNYKCTAPAKARQQIPWIAGCVNKETPPLPRDPDPSQCHPHPSSLLAEAPHTLKQI